MAQSLIRPIPATPPAATRRALCLGGGVVASLLAASETLAGTDAPGPDRKAPLADVAGLDAAIAAGDAARLEQLLHPELVWVRGSGAVGGKTDFIRGLTAPDLVIEPFASSRTRLFASGDLELWTGTNVLRGRQGGEAFVDRHHFADLWRREAGEWRLVFVQVTPSPEPGPAMETPAD